jgi:hypothetical protein
MRALNAVFPVLESPILCAPVLCERQATYCNWTGGFQISPADLKRQARTCVSTIVPFGPLDFCVLVSTVISKSVARKHILKAKHLNRNKNPVRVMPGSCPEIQIVASLQLQIG